MKISNDTPFPEHVLRRVIEWVCGQLSVPVAVVPYVNAFSIHSSRLHSTGCSGTDIAIRINDAIGPNAFVIGQHGCEGRRLPDMNSLLVFLVAHEVDHINQRLTRSESFSSRLNEKRANAVAKSCVGIFHENEGELTWLWYQSPEEETWKKERETKKQTGPKKTRLIDLE